jgi:uncharacterized protein with FMN-binding domain
VRRTAAAIIGTLAGTALLVGAKLGTPAPPADTDLTAGTVTDGGVPAGDPGAPPASGAPVSGQPAPGQPAQSGAPGSPGASAPASPGATRTTAPAATPTAGSGGGLASGTFTGTGVKEHYGTITVTITTSGGKITGVSATCGGCNSESQSISSNAFTKLRQEVLSAQSASVATVSGATYTSGAYRTSLQAAINAAKA